MANKKISIRLSTEADLYNPNNIDQQLGISTVSSLTLKRFISNNSFGSILQENSINGSKLAENKLSIVKIKEETISGNVENVGVNPKKGKIGFKTITEYNIADKTLVGSSLGPPVVEGHFQDRSIIGSDSIADLTITAAQIEDNSLLSQNFENGTLINDDFKLNSIENFNLSNFLPLSILGNPSNISSSPAHIQGSAELSLGINDEGNSLLFRSINLEKCVSDALTITNGGTGRNQVAAALSNLGMVSTGGSTLTNFLNCLEPVDTMHIATKGYADSKIKLEFTSGSSEVSSYSNLIGNLDTTQNFFYVYPPAGKTIGSLKAFISTIRQIFFAGSVDSNDILRCTYEVQTNENRIIVRVQNSEQRAKPSANWFAVWQ